MDFDEFAAVYNAFAEQRDTIYKDTWNRMRLLATITIQPHLGKGKKVTPEKLLPFPWDNKKPQHRRDPNAKRLTHEEQRKRMEAMVKKLGDKTI